VSTLSKINPTKTCILDT